MSRSRLESFLDFCLCDIIWIEDHANLCKERGSSQRMSKEGEGKRVMKGYLRIAVKREESVQHILASSNTPERDIMIHDIHYTLTEMN